MMCKAQVTLIKFLSNPVRLETRQCAILGKIEKTSDSEGKQNRFGASRVRKNVFY